MKAAAAAGGPDIVVGFFKEANKYMASRKKELELESLDSDPDSDADFDEDQDMDSDSDVDMPLPPTPPTPETLSPTPDGKRRDRRKSAEIDRRSFSAGNNVTTSVTSKK